MTLIPANGDEHATVNPPSLWWHGRPTIFVRRHNHLHRQAIREAAQNAPSLLKPGILESEDARSLRSWQHVRIMRRSGYLDRHSSRRIPAGTIDTARQQTGIEIGFLPPKANPLSPNQQQP